jgi:hypothetical protein
MKVVNNQELSVFITIKVGRFYCNMFRLMYEEP